MLCTCLLLVVVLLVAVSEIEFFRFSEKIIDFKFFFST